MPLLSGQTLQPTWADVSYYSYFIKEQLMKKNYYIDPLQLFASVFTAFFGLLIGITLIFIGRYFSAAVFIIIGAIFSYFTFETGAMIAVDQEGVRKSFLGKELLYLKWSDIAEVGVAGSNILNKGNEKRTGALYIYFSGSAMDDDERFNMMLKWPPKDKIYLRYDKDRYDFIQSIYGKKINKYNTGDKLKP